MQDSFFGCVITYWILFQNKNFLYEGNMNGSNFLKETMFKRILKNFLKKINEVYRKKTIFHLNNNKRNKLQFF